MAILVKFHFYSPPVMLQPIMIVHELLGHDPAPGQRDKNGLSPSQLLGSTFPDIRVPGIDYATIPRRSDGLWHVKSEGKYTVVAGQIDHRVTTFGYMRMDN